MDRLSIILTLMSGSLITGTLVTTAFSMGYYSWWVVGGAAVIGFLMAWPSAYYVSRLIKNNDPQWSPDRKPHEHGPIPRIGEREV
ncbi:hypothetical protein [Marivita sp. XM-24bin2]|jgi:hypothetical protein|uniref:hypothetical protein n=1 Tax=unclassified Marivita TaxID=2632480 RepID=UPI0025BCDE9F|nr:hypothetical protein [Marivita sp. XM-24bin2]MCR9108204.1 CorA family divalent cation transporter [Paracoccaceae bacterium]